MFIAPQDSTQDSMRLQFREYQDCTVMPYRLGKTSGRAPGTLEMGVFDADGACIEESLIRRRYVNGIEKQRGFPTDFGSASAAYDATAIYLGPILEHFGHFLLESLARVWFAKRHPDTPVVWSCRVGPPAREASDEGHLSRWQTDILNLLGMSNPPVFVDTPTRFKHLLIPDVGYRIQHYFHPEHVEALASVEHAPVPGRNVWLSRSRLNQLQNLSMPAVEDRLADRGWTILYPETLAVSELMPHLAAAERIAGEQGSALHNVMFLKAPRELRIDIFLRDPTRPAGIYNKNYDTIADAKGFRQIIHTVKSETILQKMQSQVEKVSSNISEYLEKLESTDTPREERPVQGKAMPYEFVQPSGANVSATRINRLSLIRGAKTYLEVGVASGKTFLNVAIETKHGVDPKFRFDIRPLESASVKFFEMTSDRYFTEFAARDMKYDIILLDGLHTFEQTFRDFCATMPHTHADTIWIIDDVFPSDVFSALPSQKDALRYRKSSGGKSRQWHGDVFKCVFAINDFFPNFDFRTVRMKGENPQTVIINRQRATFKPLNNDLEKISRMDYFAFRENKEVLNLTSEEEMLKWVKESLAN